MPSDRISEATASSMVAGMRSKISPMAGWPARKLLPKLPWIASPTNTRYCRHIGRSRPSAARTASRSIWLASGLIIISTGSPIT